MFLGDDASYRTRLTLLRGRIVDHDDTPMMQTVSFRGLQNEMLTAERFQSYGRSVVPVPPDDAAGLRAPEMVTGFIGGDRSHPVVFAMDDRRYRPKSGKPGQVNDYHYKGHSATWGDTGWSYTGGRVEAFSVIDRRQLRRDVGRWQGNGAGRRHDRTRRGRKT